MTIFLRGACALALTAVLVGQSYAEDETGLVNPASYDTNTQPAAAEIVNEAGDIQLTSCDTCDYGACDCGPNVLGSGVAPVRRSRLFVGGEYLSVRANFSEATAYRELNLVNNTETLHQFDFDYGDSYRVYGGLRLPECGGELRFGYTNFSSDGSFDSGPQPAAASGTTFTSPFEVIVPGENDSLSGDANVSIDSYDVAFAKTIPLGGCMSCDCGDCGSVCGDPCGCCPCPCPAWDLQWSGGIRVANVDSQLNYASTIVSTTAVPNRTATSSVSFDGVDLRTGLLGRRYIGQSGWLSFFVRGDISLLLGEVDYYAAGTTFTRTEISTTEVIPVTEIEAGATMFLTRNFSVSGGYMLSAWHDLGHRAEYDYSSTGTQLQSMDDANMLMFDGFFARAEATF